MRRTRVRRTRPGLVPRAAPRGYADHLGTDAPRKPRRTPTPTPHTHSPVSGAFLIIRHSRIYTFRKNFDCKKCPVHLVSFIKHHDLFVPYIVDILIFLTRKSWFRPPYMSPGPKSKGSSLLRRYLVLLTILRRK